MPTTNYIWDVETDSYLMETDGSNVTQAVYTNEPVQFGNLVSQRRGSTTNYCHFDALGSTRQLTDGTQTVTDTFTYDAWGNEVMRTGTTTLPFRWIGAKQYQLEGETEWFYVRARVYAPTTARWLSVDPIGFPSGPHRYAYSHCSPITIIDPTGLFCIVCRWRRYASGDTFTSLDANFAGGATPVQTSANALFARTFAPPMNLIFGNARPATAAETILDVSTAGNIGGAPPPGKWQILRHPIIVFADVCFDNPQDCVVKVEEQRAESRYNFATNSWTTTPWSPWEVKFVSEPADCTAGPAVFFPVRGCKLLQPPIIECPWRIVIYDEPHLDARFADPRKNVLRKEARRKITIADLFSLTDKFLMGWVGNVADGFTDKWEYHSGTSNAGSPDMCC